MDRRHARTSAVVAGLLCLFAAGCGGGWHVDATPPIEPVPAYQHPSRHDMDVARVDAKRGGWRDVHITRSLGVLTVRGVSSKHAWEEAAFKIGKAISPRVAQRYIVLDSYGLVRVIQTHWSYPGHSGGSGWI